MLPLPGNLLRQQALRLVQQRRNVIHVRKTIRFDVGYGNQPLITQDDWQKAEEEGTLDDIVYKKIRFPSGRESNSPLYNKQFERFIGHLQGGGRLDLAYRLMNDTFYHIKSIQFKRLRKRQEKEQKRQQEEAEGKVTASVKDPTEEGEDHVEMNPVTILATAIENCRPLVITKKVQRGGATFQVPFPIMYNNSEYLAMKWLIWTVTERPKPRLVHFPKVMASELLDAYYGRGKVIKKRDDIHRLADANKAFAHYRWG